MTSMGFTMRDALPVAAMGFSSVPHRGWGIGGRTDVYRSSAMTEQARQATPTPPHTSPTRRSGGAYAPGDACCTVFTCSGRCGRSFNASASWLYALMAVNVLSALAVTRTSHHVTHAAARWRCHPLPAANAPVSPGSRSPSMSLAGHCTLPWATCKWRSSTYDTMACTMVGRFASGTSHTVVRDNHTRRAA